MNARSGPVEHAQPEAPTLKSRLRSLLVDTPLRRLAAPAHRGLTAAELLSVRLADQLRADSALPTDQARRITAIVKTFERPVQLQRLLLSLGRLFPGLPVIVADDSREPGRYVGARTIALPYDAGVSAGRQAALAAVDTEYSWVLDDDFVLYRGTRLGLAVSLLDENPALDILGGPVIDLPLGIKQGERESGIYPTPAAPILALGSRLGSAVVRDKVPNFFVARTSRLRMVGWDHALKRLDHADFFTRARGVLVTAYCDQFRCLHTPTPFDRDYMRSRLDLAADAALLHERYFA